MTCIKLGNMAISTMWGLPSVPPPNCSYLCSKICYGHPQTSRQAKLMPLLLLLLLLLLASS